MTYLLLLIPFIGFLAINLPSKNRQAEISFWVALGLLFFQMGLSVFHRLGPWAGYFSAELEKLLGFNLAIDSPGLLLVFTAAMVGLVSLAVGWSTTEDNQEKINFVNLLLLSIIGINGLSMATDLFSLYVFIEVIAVAAFILIALKGERDALEGVWKYLILSVVASTLMLCAIALLLMAAGTISFSALKAGVPAANQTMMITAAAFFFSGLFIKAGIAPFHGWVADAYSCAPPAVSVLLAGIITKASGIFVLFRLLEILGNRLEVQNLLLIFGSLSIVVGALLALGQKDMKRMLAYSSVSQMGYIIAAFGIGTQLGFFAAFFHFFNHAVSKSQLFANAAAVEKQTGSRDMDAMGGLAQKMPFTGATSAIAALSTAGLPPLAGFWSKLLIIAALWISGHYIYAVIAALSSILTLAYFLSFQRRVFFGKAAPAMEKITEPNAGLIFPAAALSAAAAALGIFFPFALTWIMR